MVVKINPGANEQEIQTPDYKKLEAACELTNTSEDILKVKVFEYRESLTFHGLSRALTGNLIEKIFWGFCILFCIGVIIRVVINSVTKYNSNEVLNRFQSMDYSKAESLFLTICPFPNYKRDWCLLVKNTSTDYQYCSSRHVKDNNFSKKFDFDTYFNIYEWYNENMYILAEVQVSDGFFKPNLSNYVKKSHHHCVRFDLSYFNTSISLPNEISIETAYPNELIEVIVHDSGETYPYLQMQSIFIPSNGSVSLFVDMKQYKRLEHPYASNCTKNSTSMIFPGEYSKLKCAESLKCINSFKKCGNTYSYCKDFIPSNVKVKFENLSASDDCIYSEYKIDYTNECALPCQENVYTTTTSEKIDDKLENWRLIRVYYPINPYFHFYEEVPLYSIEQLLGECGGMLGLFTGASLISILEFIIFLSIILWKSFRDKKRFVETPNIAVQTPDYIMQTPDCHVQAQTCT